MIAKKIICTCIQILLLGIAVAQDKSSFKFENITPGDFDITGLKVDTTKGAVIIADVGVSSFDGHSKNWFTLVFKHKCRVLIINKNGFDLAKVIIPLYISSNKIDEEKIKNLTAATYNLIDGKVVETKLNNDNIFKDKYDNNHVIEKFTLPAVKEGSIIEYSYTTHSDFLSNLQPWIFQNAYPTVWSEYEVDLPDFFEYLILKSGYINYDITEHPVHHEFFNSGLDAYVTNYRWVMKNVPAITEEKYTTSLMNHVARLEFQLSASRLNGYRKIMSNWNIAGAKLLQSEDFGADLRANNLWLDNDMDNILKTSTTKLEKAKAIYYYIKNNIKCNDYTGIYLSQPLKDIFKSKAGSIADVNLLLTAMLHHAGLTADPIILSTKKHGATNEFYPILNKYNYVITKLSLDNKEYYLDASQFNNGFGYLPAYCYNGHSRVINQNPVAVYLVPDNLSENKITNVMLYNDDILPGKWEGTFQTAPGYYHSAEIRDFIKTKSNTEFEKKLKNSDYELSDIKVEDLENYESTVHINYTIKTGEGKSDIIYFNPMLKEGYIETPFKSAERKYPVEMPYKLNETYTLYIEIPKGYAVDELPASTKVILNENDGFFEYSISKSSEGINMRSKIKLEKATFPPEDYEALRNFFSLVVKKQSEQIVFKKKQ